MQYAVAMALRFDLGEQDSDLPALVAVTISVVAVTIIVLPCRSLSDKTFADATYGAGRSLFNARRTAIVAR